MAPTVTAMEPASGSARGGDVVVLTGSGFATGAVVTFGGVAGTDVAVLDYSSLRFDWMLSGKPAVFFVPDLDDYLSARTALFDYRPTAPGPLLRTTEEVIAALRDLDGITDTYAADRATLNATFQPLNDGHAAARVVDSFFAEDAGPAS